MHSACEHQKQIRSEATSQDWLVMRTGLTLQVSEIPSVLNFYCRDEFHLKDLWLVFVLMKGKSHTVVFNLFPTGTTHPLKPPSPPIVLWCFVYQCLFIFAWLHAFSGLPLARKDTLWSRPVLCGGGRVGRPGNICPYLAADTIEVVEAALWHGTRCEENSPCIAKSFGYCTG